MSTPAHVRPELDFVDLFAVAAQQVVTRLLDVDPRADVPTCPGWSVYDLVVHLGNVHAWAATVVETSSPAPEQDDRPTARRSKALSTWYAGKAGDLYAVLRGTPADRPCWNFAFGEGSVEFWLRRQLHETTIHAVDLDLADGRRASIEPAIGADGVDEVLRVFLHRMHGRGFPAELTAPVTVVATDTGRAWTVRPGDPGDAPAVTDEDEPAGDRVEGPAAALYALLWKRLPAADASLALRGDTARLQAFLASRLTA